jgi:hypothetical protein
MTRTPRAAVLLLALAACADRARPAAPAAGDSAAHPPPPVPVAAADSAGRGGQVVYVPVYSHIYIRDERRSMNLAVTLSVRNTDPERAITVGGVRYYDTGGRLLHTYVAAPLRLGPLASTEFVVAEGDTRGGAGANFLVEWRAEGSVTEPVIEAVMIGTRSGQGISFTSVGRPLVRR